MIPISVFVRACARLSRYLVEIRQGRLQVDRERRSRSRHGARKAAAIISSPARTLTCQAGLAVQQDLALGALIGISHAERNGHHYVDGFAETRPPRRRRSWNAHSDLYASDGDTVRLSIRDGDLLTDSLAIPGFASSVHPDWSLSRRSSGQQQSCRSNSI